MEPDYWRRIEDLFHEALERSPTERSAFLDSACHGDESLRREIESLLTSADEEAFTANPAFHDALSLMERRHSLAGRLIGPYRVIREIGHGGMGAVYLATRADGVFQKEVAIKVIKRGIDPESIVTRFHSERQILASLDHPNITRLLDGGATEDGGPYFVMEHIQGEPIDAWCDARKLHIEARLRLFQSVCAAVHYAHQNLVIHRDLKPGNVLVTADGVPKLLDFGIAKLLTAAGSQEDATVTQARLLTPEYASPEQLRGDTVTTASDVYSLGVLLYVLLTGHGPYRLAGKTASDAERIIREEEPEKPSRAIAGVEADLTSQSLSAARETTPEKLRRRLSGDLDNIVLMAMRKEPLRRYGSVEQFSEDIRRHLNKLPVIARPDTPGYRAAKFVSRHKTGMAAAAVVFVTLATGIIATLWQARLATIERDRARAQTAKAERINKFLQDTLSYASPGYSSPNVNKDPNVKLSEAIDAAAARAETELKDQPEVLAAVETTIGGVYLDEARWNQAEPLLRAALEKQIRLHGPDHHDTAVLYRVLGNVLYREGKLPEAETLMRRAVNTYRGEAKHGHLDAMLLSGALHGLGLIQEQKDAKAAEASFREALQYGGAQKGKERGMIAATENELAIMAFRRGDLVEAERLEKASLNEYRNLPPGTYAEMGISLSNLGFLLLQQGRYAEAEPLMREALDLQRRVLGNSHFSTAGALMQLGGLLYRKGDYAEAEKDLRESLDIFNATLAKGHVAFASPLMYFGQVLTKTSRAREAEPYLRESLAISSRVQSGGGAGVPLGQGALGECLMALKRYKEAEALMLDSLTGLKARVGEHDPRISEATGRLVALYEAWGKPAEAARYR